MSSKPVPFFEGLTSYVYSACSTMMTVVNQTESLKQTKQNCNVRNSTCRWGSLSNIDVGNGCSTSIFCDSSFWWPQGCMSVPRNARQSWEDKRQVLKKLSPTSSFNTQLSYLCQCLWEAELTTPAFHHNVTLSVVTQSSRAGLPLWSCQGAAGTNAALCRSCALCLRHVGQHEQPQATCEQSLWLYYN